MNANKALWEKGDFTQIARCMRAAGKTAVDALGITPGMKVLDLGCGDGNTAVPIAQLGADVTGIDIAQNLVAAGNLRAKELKLSRLQFQEGDACNLAQVANGTFDLTVSFFGAMFAPKPLDVAKEMVRVTKSGGRVVMGNWIPNDPTLVSQVLKTVSAFTPPPPEGFVSPMLWGVESNVIERFGAAGIPPQQITMTRETFLFDSREKTPQQFMDLFRQYYGPTMNAFEAAEKNGKAAELFTELVALANAQNLSKDGGMHIPAKFLKVTVNV
jgi:ubiquinone/menaquinone biosynthesis C-methylase UbiE